MLRFARSTIIGFMLAATLALALALLSESLPRPMLWQNIKTTPISQQLAKADRFSACIALSIALLENKATLSAIANPRWLHPIEPCQQLEQLQQTILNGSAETEAMRQESENPLRHWGGTGFLLRPLLLFFSLDFIQALYALLTALAFFCLWRAGHGTNPELRKLLLWLIPLAILPGGAAIYAINIAHAPAFFMPIFALAAMLHWPQSLQNPAQRPACITALGFCCIYFDMLFGVFQQILVLLWLLVFFLKPSPQTMRATFILGFSTFLAFSIGLIGGILLKIAITMLATQDLSAFSHYASGLLMRLQATSVAGENITPQELSLQMIKASEVFFLHPFITIGFYALGFCAWVFGLRAAYRLQEYRSLALALAAPCLFIILWLYGFANHSYIHGFMTRLLYLPPTMGLLLAFLSGAWRVPLKPLNNRYEHNNSNQRT